MEDSEYLIIGAGLSGLSASYHLGHARCTILESSHAPMGHAGSHQEAGLTWDEGPHVSFTQSPYVKELFSQSVAGMYHEYPVIARNWFYGQWIDHPVQTHLYQVPSELRQICLNSFRLVVDSRKEVGYRYSSYREYCENAFGKEMTETFLAKYTKKYWLRELESLDTDWIGSRVHFPEAKSVFEGAIGELNHPTHYIQRVRYPVTGGYASFGKILLEDANIRYDSRVSSVDLLSREVTLADGRKFRYRKLISTMPLPKFVNCINDAPTSVREHASRLKCSAVVLITILAKGKQQVEGNWFYVYDVDKAATRIHILERMATDNVPLGHTGIQVEVYFDQDQLNSVDVVFLEKKVQKELEEMGFLRLVDIVSIRSQRLEWANVIFGLERREVQDTVLSWLAENGLERESDDLEPTSDWSTPKPSALGNLILAGRFGQWKYFWTDDCVLRGKRIAEIEQGKGD